MPFGTSHVIILNIAKSALSSFFHEIRVVNEQNVPKDGPILVACTHHNMVVDPAVLSTTFPHGRHIHYWAKSTLFANPLAKKLLLNSGNIPVNRKSKDNQSMFKGTFDVLALGEVVAVFPEGTSYTEPRIMQVKDGAAWAALEYMKWAASDEGRAKKAPALSVIPAGLVYTNKSKYRSSAVIKYGKPIPLTALAEEFMAPDGAKPAVKKLTKAVEQSLFRMTINAEDWETLYAGRMARELLWEGSTPLNLDEFVGVSQILIDLIMYPNPCTSAPQLKEALLKYSSLLKASKLTNEALSGLPLPRALDPKVLVPLPSRLSTFAFLVWSTLACAAPLPFFVIPLLVNIPAYIMSRYGARLVEEEEETQAQMKIVFGLLITAITYSLIFFGIWTLFFMSPLGAALAGSAVWLLYTFYSRTIDDFYARAKRLVAAWRVLIGVWGPRRWDLSPSEVKTYTVPEIPPPNIWIDRPLTPTPGANSTTPAAPAASSTKEAAPPRPRKKKPASRSLIRHVLRARIEASQALAAFLEELERVSPRVRVSPHLGHPEGAKEDGYVSGVSSSNSGDYLDVGAAQSSTSGTTTPASINGQEKKSFLEGREIIDYLRRCGAHIAHRPQDSDWAAAASSSDGEGPDGRQARHAPDLDAEVVWVSPSSK